MTYPWWQTTETGWEKLSSFPMVQGLLGNGRGLEPRCAWPTALALNPRYHFLPLGSCRQVFQSLWKVGLERDLFVGLEVKDEDPNPQVAEASKYLLTSGFGVHLHFKADQREPGLGVSSLWSDVCCADRHWDWSHSNEASAPVHCLLRMNKHLWSPGSTAWDVSEASVN